MYKVGLKDEVASLVAGFDPVTLHYWNVALSAIADDPWPRSGQYSERLVPIRGFPWYTYNYWITETESISGERIFVFTAEFFDYRPVFVIDREGREVEVFSVRSRWVYDPP
jgi:hypothetical protein